MTLVGLTDWIIIVGLLIFYAVFGIWYSRSEEKTASEYFLSGRSISWWLLGVSLVATTFSADTPNLVTDMVRKYGIAGNWQWWAFLITGMTTVFIFSVLWRRSEVMTDLEFYEIRYGGKSASFLRGFRAVYLGFFFNIMIMATTTLAIIKISAVIIGVQPIVTLSIASVVILAYSTIGGLKAVILTDAIQFGIAMAGSIGAAIYVLSMPEVGGMSGLLSSPAVAAKLNFLPDFSDTATLLSIFIIPIAVQWWSVWYPGAEPGGGGYVAQRILSAKNEKEALGAVLFFNVAHYALRPWPWIIVALASIMVYPNLESIQTAMPYVDPSLIKDDIAYPAMIRLIPTGLLGVVIASLVAAYMSTIATHLNWGASYIVNDVYKRFINPNAAESKLVNVGRASTVVLMILQALFALTLENALQAFNILLTIGAGTGLIFMLRWFWWRISAFTEIAGMIISFAVALFFNFVDVPIPEDYKFILGVLITTIGWLAVTFIMPPTDDHVLFEFYKKIHPYGPGWASIRQKMGIKENVKEGLFFSQVVNIFLGVFAVYFLLFGSGYIIFGNLGIGGALVMSGLLLTIIIFKRIKEVR